MQADEEQLKAIEEQRRAELLKRMLLREGMTAKARERLARVKLANPELAAKAELICLQLIQQGRKIDEAMLIKILEKLRPKRSFRIMRW